MINITTEED